MIFWIGRIFFRLLSLIGHFLFFVARIFVESVHRPFYGKQLMQSLWDMLFCALPLVSLSSFCTGMVLALQTGDGFFRFGVGGEFALPEVISLSIVRELAPVLSGLMMSGRWCALITSELASMRLTSQIDALLTLSVNPVRYLAVPKVFSAVMAMPFLVFVSSISGIVGGYVATSYSFPSLSYAYVRRSLDVLHVSDILMCLQKSVFFGFMIVVIAIYSGWNVKGGSQELGLCTTRSVVRTGFLVLIINFFITSFLT